MEEPFENVGLPTNETDGGVAVSPSLQEESKDEEQAGPSQDLPFDIPAPKNDKERAAWEKYKDQFKVLCDALKKEGVEVLVFSKSKEGTDVCGTDEGLNFLKRQPDLKETFDEHFSEGGSPSKAIKKTTDDEATPTVKRGRGRPPKKSGAASSSEQKTPAAKKRPKSPESEVIDETPVKKRGRSRKSVDIDALTPALPHKEDVLPERRRSNRFAIKEEPSDEGYPDDSRRPKKKHWECEHCGKEFMIECLLDRHYNFCKESKSPTKETSKLKKRKVKVEPGSEHRKVTTTTTTDSNNTEIVEIFEKETTEVGEKEGVQEEPNPDDVANKENEEFVDDDNDSDFEVEEVESDDDDWNPVGDTPPIKNKHVLKTGSRKRGRPKKIKKEKDASLDEILEGSTVTEISNGMDKEIDELQKKFALEGKSAAKLVVDKTILNMTPGGVVCPVCNKRFKENKYLVRHMVVHAGDRNFNCQLCDKAFARKYDLNVHLVRIHCWVKSGRGKVRKEGNLEEGEVVDENNDSSHIKSETDEEEKACDFCEESFKEYALLESHLEEKHSEIEKNFNCLECDEKFHMMFQLEKHNQNIHGAKPFSCNVCSKGFDSKVALYTHNQIHTDSKSHLCDFCGKGFTLRKYLAKHKQRHLAAESAEDKEKVYICGICQISFDQLPDYQGHMKTHKEEFLRNYQCDQCPKRFFKLAHLKRHLLTHASERAYKCQECGKCYKDPDTLRKHQKFIHSVGVFGAPIIRTRFNCDQCDKFFFNKGHLKRHMFRHTGERPYSCEECGKSFSEKKTLEMHTRIHTGERPYECKDCGRRFIQIAHLKRHQFLHTKIKNFHCTECKKKFYSSSDLKKHMRVHNNFKPYKCDMCDMSFTQKNILVCHKRIHTGERPYICDICSRGFTQMGSLATHRRLHTGERPYKCPTCNQGFVSKERMKFHQFVHTGISPHICHICGKGFRLKFKLQSHLDSHEGIFRHKCTYCSKGFLEKSKLKRHMRQVHNVEGLRITYSSQESAKAEDFDDVALDDEDGAKQEIIIRNLGQFDQSTAEEVIEYVTIPGNLAETEDVEASNAVSHITLEAGGSNLAALMDGNNITIPQDSIIYQDGSQGEEVVYVVIPEENQTVILS